MAQRRWTGEQTALVWRHFENGTLSPHNGDGEYLFNYHQAHFEDFTPPGEAGRHYVIRRLRKLQARRLTELEAIAAGNERRARGMI